MGVLSENETKSLQNDSRTYGTINDDTEDLEAEDPETYKKRWQSIRIVYGNVFISSVNFTVCVSSIWPFMQALNSSAQTSWLGWVIASYSVGQIIASPLFGFLANFFKKIKNLLLISIFINLAGNALYCYVQNFPTNSILWVLIAARFVIGFGGGNVAAMRSYVSQATTLNERTAAGANIALFQAIGFILGPAIQAALYPIGYKGPLEVTALHLNMYTAPGWFSVIAGVANFLLILIAFKEYHVEDGEDNSQDSIIHRNTIKNKSISSINDNSTDSSLLKSNEIVPGVGLDYLATCYIICIFFVVLFIFTVFETISSPLSMDEWAWSPGQATLYNGIIMLVAGGIAIFTIVVIKILVKRFSERLILIAGFVLCFLGFVIYLPWGDKYPPLKPENTIPVHHNYTTSMPISSTTKGNESLGCNPIAQEWCRYVPQVFFAQFIGGSILVAIGYPITSVLTYTIYSKVLGPITQGVWMGWLTASGSFARIVGPIYVSQVYENFGPRVAFGSIAGFLLLTIISILIAYRRLISYRVRALTLSGSHSSLPKT